MKRIEIHHPVKPVHGEWAIQKYVEMQSAGNTFLHWTKSAKDLDIKDLTWDTYGKQDEELLIFVATHGKKKWFAAVKSPVFYPKMIDRIGPIDIQDSILENWVQNEMMDYIREEIAND